MLNDQLLKTNYEQLIREDYKYAKEKYKKFMEQLRLSCDSMTANYFNCKQVVALVEHMEKLEQEIAKIKEKEGGEKENGKTKSNA